MARSSYVASALLVLTLATILRFAHLVDQGVLEYDEGWLIDVARQSATEWAEGGLKTYSNFKSSHTSWASLLLSFRLFGVSQRSIQYPFALYGVVGVAGAMWLVSLAYGRSASLLAGLLLAVSPMHVLYSRTVGTDSPGAAFVLLAYAFLFMSFRRRMGPENAVGCSLAGIAMGLAVTANYRAFAACFAPFLMLCALVRPGPRLIRYALAYLIGFVSILVAWDLALRVAFPASGGYFHAFLVTDHHTFPQNPSAKDWLALFRIREPGYYLRSLLDLDNPAVLAIFALLPLLSCLPWNSASDRRSDYAILMSILGPALVFLVLASKAPRGFSFIQPVITVAAARSIQLISRAFRHVRPAVLRSIVPAALASVAITWGLARCLSPDVVGRSNPFRAAFQQIGKGVGGTTGDPGFLVILDRAAPDLYAIETRRRIARLQMGSTLADIVKAFERDYRYWLVDGQFSVYGHSLGYVWPAFDALHPQMLIPADTYIRLDHFVEHTVYMHDSYEDEVRRYRAWLRRWGPNLPVYDLSRLVAPLAWHGSSAEWYRVGCGIVAMERASASPAAYRVVRDDARPADVVEATIAVDFNRLPFQGGLALLAEDGAGAALYLDLRREESVASITTLTPQGREAGRVSYKIPPSMQVRTLQLSWPGNVLRGFINGSEVLSLDRPRPTGGTFGGLVASPSGSFDVVRYRSSPALPRDCDDRRTEGAPLP